MRKKITQEQFDALCATIDTLTQTMVAIGVVEFRFSKAKREIFWDTENGGQVDGKLLSQSPRPKRARACA